MMVFFEKIQRCENVILTTDKDKKMCPYYYPSSHPYIEGPQCLRADTYVANISCCELWKYTLTLNEEEKL